MSKDRLREAEDVLLKLAAKNGIEVTQKSIDVIRNSRTKSVCTIQVVIVSQ